MVFIVKRKKELIRYRNEFYNEEINLSIFFKLIKISH